MVHFNNNINRVLVLSISILAQNILIAKAAGILPFCHDKQHKTYFYFSREVGGPDKGTFADFGGRFEQNDTAITAAAREFAEESISLFKTRNGIELNEQATLDLINKNTPDHVGSKYTLYFLRVRNDSNTIFQDFLNKRKSLLKKKAKKGHTTQEIKKLKAQTEKDVLFQ